MMDEASLYSEALGLYLNCMIENGLVRRLFVSSEPEFEVRRNDVLLKVSDYLSGRDVDLSEIPIKMDGTEFQVKVWDALRKIPKGELASYSEIARKIGIPNGARAVGNAVGSNHLLLLVPCHRVVSKNGLGGFSAEGGVETKKKILDVERLKTYEP